jgi:hypothetical protein
MEFALSMPTYLSFNKEFDRYIFRESISKRFNTSNVWRKEKQDQLDLLAAGLRFNFCEIKTTCEKGFFYNHGYIDGIKLKKNLNNFNKGLKNKLNLWNFANFISAELFINSWQD